MARSDTTSGVTRQQMTEARGWLIDAAVVQASVVPFLSRDEVVRAVQASYEGGWAQFSADSVGVQL